MPTKKDQSSQVNNSSQGENKSPGFQVTDLQKKAHWALSAIYYLFSKESAWDIKDWLLSLSCELISSQEPERTELRDSSESLRDSRMIQNLSGFLSWFERTPDDEENEISLEEIENILNAQADSLNMKHWKIGPDSTCQNCDQLRKELRRNSELYSNALELAKDFSERCEEYETKLENKKPGKNMLLQYIEQILHIPQDEMEAIAENYE